MSGQLSSIAYPPTVFNGNSMTSCSRTNVTDIQQLITDLPVYNDINYAPHKRLKSRHPIWFIEYFSTDKVEGYVDDCLGRRWFEHLISGPTQRVRGFQALIAREPRGIRERTSIEYVRLFNYTFVWAAMPPERSRTVWEPLMRTLRRGKSKLVRVNSTFVGRNPTGPRPVNGNVTRVRGVIRISYVWGVATLNNYFFALFYLVFSTYLDGIVGCQITRCQYNNCIIIIIVRENVHVYIETNFSY